MQKSRALCAEGVRAQEARTYKGSAPPPLGDPSAPRPAAACCASCSCSSSSTLPDLARAASPARRPTCAHKVESHVLARWDLLEVCLTYGPTWRAPRPLPGARQLYALVALFVDMRLALEATLAETTAACFPTLS